MRRSKDEGGQADTHDLVALFKALADPSRLRLVKILAAPPSTRAGRDKCSDGPLCVNALAAQLGVTQSAVSQHLRVLRNVGLVRGTRRGPFMHYSVALDQLERCMQEVRSHLGMTRAGR